MSRTENSLKNAKTAILGQLLNNVLKFVCRTAFIYTLGKEYLGISSLYSNILTLLSISELGFASAVSYSLYGPLAKQEEGKIRSLMQFYKKAYRVIGMVILGLGLLLTPFLPKLMTGVTDKVNIYLYYLLYLVQTAISYLFLAYKSTLLVADQKRYINDSVMYVTQIGMNAIQIGILFFWRSFLAYTVVGLLRNIVQNLIVSKMVDRRYPYLKEPAEPISQEEKKKVMTRVYAMSLFRISTAIGTATDNLIISAYISVQAVGFYDNYYMVIQIIQNLLTSISRAFTASVGNLFAVEKKEHSEFMFHCMNLLNNWAIIFCSVSFLTLFQHLIQVWIGKEYLLAYPVVIIIVMNFATNYQQNVVQIFKEASGLFVRGKYRAVMTAVLNLGISLLLVQSMGIGGVFLGSIISRLVTTWCYDSWLLFRKGFDKSPASYYFSCVGVLGLIAGITVLNLWIFQWIPQITWTTMFVKCVITTVVTNGICLILFWRTKEFAYLVSMAKRIIKRKRA